MKFQFFCPARRQIAATLLPALKVLSVISCWNFGNLAVAQTTAIDSNLDIHIPALLVDSTVASADLNYQDSVWQLIIGELAESPNTESVSGRLDESTLIIECVVYEGKSYRTMFQQANNADSAPTFSLFQAEDNPDCGGDLNVTLDLFPASVSAYALEDTATLLAKINSQLQGLSIDDFFEEAFTIIRTRDTDQRIADGVLDEYDVNTANLTNISDEYYFQTKEVQSLVKAILQNYDRSTLTEQNQLSYDIYLDHLEKELEWAEYRDFEYPATYGFFGYPGSTEQFFTRIFTISDAREAQLYLALLNQVDRRFDQISDLLTARQNAGIIEPFPTLSFSQSLVSAMGNSSATGTTYYQAFDERLDELDNISVTEKVILREQAIQIIEEKVLPAYQELAVQMQGLLPLAPANIGFGQFPGGDEFYEFVVRFYTSSDMTPNDVYLMGLQELARIHDELDALFSQLGYPSWESLAQKWIRVDQDSGTIPAENALSFHQQLIDETYEKLGDYFSLLPEQRVAVAGDMFGGFYITGTEDGSRPGTFYADNDSDQAYTTLPSLTYHEAVPGHHLQIALALELDLPEFRRKQRLTSYTEGWALYAERLASDLGWYDDDIYGDLGRLQFEALRAARLIVDTGIHSLGWTYNQADTAHIFNVGYPGSISRYSVWPGQATAYTTGMVKILELRDRAQSELGELYDIKDFHAAVTGNGSMPLNILENVVDNYIAEKSAMANGQ